MIIADIWFAFCLAALLGFTFKLYWDTYFTLDDFNNLFLAQLHNGSQILRNLVDPTIREFRPVGIASYWMFLHCCDIDPVPYHAAAWFLHTLNVGLVFVLLRRIVRSGYAAAGGAALFACQDVFAEIYWNFGTIFELLSTLLVLAAIYIHIRFKPSLYRILLVAAIYLLAIKAKEMAVTLPIVLTLHELLLPAETSPRRDKNLALWSWAGLSILVLIGGWFVFTAVSYTRTLPPQDPYYMVFTPVATIQGYGWYLDRLLHTHLASWVYMAMGVAILGYISLLRDRCGAFFLFYTLVTLLPVIPLVNHRGPFYWYLPFFGIAGLVALSTQWVTARLQTWLTPNVSLVAGMVLFAAFCREQYFMQKGYGVFTRIFMAERDQERRNLIQGLRAMLPPRSGETLYFESAPPYFDEGLLDASSQVAFRRTDVHAKLVQKFPPDASYRLRFEDGRLERAP
jgi:hypothetical protein